MAKARATRSDGEWCVAFTPDGNATPPIRMAAGQGTDTGEAFIVYGDTRREVLEKLYEPGYTVDANNNVAGTRQRRDYSTLAKTATNKIRAKK